MRCRECGRTIDPKDPDFTLRAYVREPLDPLMEAAHLAAGEGPTPFMHARCADERSFACKRHDDAAAGD